MRRIAFIIFTLLITGLAVFAQNIQFMASAPRVVEVGEQFEITYSITQQPSSLEAPKFKNLNLLGGPSTSSSSSVQFVNGKVTQSSSYSYTYYFSASTPGTFTVDPAKATVDGKQYTSNSLTIQVAGVAQSTSSQANTQQSNTNTNTQDADAVETSNDDVFVRVIVDKNTLYQGECIVATIKLFTRYNISELGNAEPAFNGFFREDIETQPLRSLTKEVYNNKVYYTGVLKRVLLYPQKSGDITINSFDLQTVVQMQVKSRGRSVFDDFWGPQVQEVKKTVKSRPVTIKVKPLPGNAPASFKGAVGSFTFKAALDKQNVKTNDAINLKVAISGTGNLKTIEPFDIKFPSDFETYDPKTSVNVKASVSGSSGNKSFEYLMIPRHSGSFKIDPIEFTYFDTQSKQYKTLSSGEFNIVVEKGPNESSTTVVTGVGKEDVKFLGKDIQFIKTQVPEFRKKGDYFFGSLKFWLSFLIALVVFILLNILLQKQIRENANVLAVRNKKANKVAHKRLKDAHIFMKGNKNEEFFEYILKALWGYMSDKLSIPVSELSRERVVDETAKRNIEQELIQKFLSILDTCEFARYSPTQASSQMDEVYNDAISVISKIEQKMK